MSENSNTNNSNANLKKSHRQRRLIDYAEFARLGTTGDRSENETNSDDVPSTSTGRRRGRQQKSPVVTVVRRKSSSSNSDDENVKHRKIQNEDKTNTDDGQQWYSIEDQTRRHHDPTNTDITSFRVRANFDDVPVRNLQEYQGRIENMMSGLIAEVANEAAQDDMVKVMLISSSLANPIQTAPVPFAQLTPESILECIENVFQSNKFFIHDDGFLFYAAVTHRPRGMGRKTHKVFTAAQAVKCLRSIVNIRTPDGLCLPACLLLAQALSNGDTQTYNLWKRTDRPQLRRAAAAYAQTVLCRRIEENQGCTFDDLDVFQNMLAHEYQIKVYRWGPPTRKCIYVGQSSAETPKHIYLMFENEHFDLIKSLPAFFQSDNYCHRCEKPFSDKRRHACVVTCRGCFRQNCINRDGNMDIFCPDCHRFFPGNRCFIEHSIAQPGGRSFCSRVKYCFTCNKLRCEWGKRENKHVCGGMFCINCDAFKERNHKCYMRKIAKTNVSEETSDATNGDTADSEESDQQSDDDSGDIAENRARDEELQDGVITGPSAEDEADFRGLTVCYFDSEAFVSDNDGIHIPNLIIAQASDTHEEVFDGTDATDKFCSWAISAAHKNWTFISHYGRKYDTYFPQKWILEHGHTKPFTIMRGCSVMLLYVKKFNIRFIDSGCFLAPPLAKLPTMFGLQDEIKKGTFPHRFNKPENFDYEGPMPSTEMYDPNRMSSENRRIFLEWHNDQVQRGHVFNFHSELLAYCRDDVKILRICCEKFRLLFFNQSTVDPFACLTIASACNKVFRKLFLPRNTISLIPPSGYFGNDIQSHAALEWIGWMSYSTGLQIQHRNNGGEVRVVTANGRVLKLDGACQTNGRKLAFEFYGCWFHGCPKCYTGTTINPLFKLSMLELYDATLSREASLKHNGWFVDSIWHCQYKLQKEENDNLQNYVARYGVPAPLNPRDAFMGGRVNATQLYCEAPPGMAIRYYDINRLHICKKKTQTKMDFDDFSLYPFCNKYKSYPVGHPVILTGSEIDINAIQNYYGLFKGRILPPRNLFHPLLGYRTNKKLLFPLCRLCADTQDQGPCNHNQADRALSGTWTTIEVVKAMDLGYIILDCSEVWHFSEQSDTLFKGMMNMYLKSKQEARGWPDGCNTEAEKQAYVDNYFDLEGVHLDPDNIDNNPGRYANSKICLNSVWGKFGEREGLANTIYIDNEVDFWNMLKNEQYRIVDYSFPTNHYVQVTYEDRKEFLLPNLHTNVVIAAFTTAFARLELYKSLENLQNHVLYFDTDSVFFLDEDPQNPDKWRPPIGEQLGVYKDEVGADDFIVQAAFAGPKNYQYTTQNGKTCMKVRGFTLNHQASQDLTHAAMHNIIVNQDRKAVVNVSMGTNIRKDKSTWTLSNFDNVKQYRFTYDKRILLPNFTTIPYGYIGPHPQPVGIVPPPPSP